MADALPIRVQLFYDGSWHDAPAYTRQAIGIGVRGRQDLSGRSNPVTATLALNNRNLEYTPRLPSSPLYGVLKRNTPLRLVFPSPIVDRFSRTVSDGVGQADTGQTWQVHPSAEASAFDVTDGQLVIAGVDHDRVAVIPESITDTDIMARVMLHQGDVGSGHQTGLYARFGDLDNFYRFVIFPGQVMGVPGEARLFLDAVVDGELTELGEYITTIEADTWYWMRLQVDGGNLRGRLWLDGEPEPAEWQMSAYDDRLASGGVGVGTTVFDGTATAEFDDFESPDIWFTGEVENWPQRSNITGTDVWVPITATGVLQRLAAPGRQAPVQTPLRREITSRLRPQPREYWPLDEPAGATVLRSAVGGIDAVPTISARPGEAPDLYGGRALLGYGPNVVAPTESQDLILTARPGPSYTEAAIVFWHCFLPDRIAQDAPWPNNHDRVDPDIEISPSTPADSIWFAQVAHQVRFANCRIDISIRTGDQESDPDSIWLTFVDLPNESGGDILTFSLPRHELREGWHEIKVELEQFGPDDISVFVTVDDIEVPADSTDQVDGYTLGALDKIRLARTANWFDPFIPAPINQWMPYGVGHFAIWDTIQVDLSTYQAARGRIGERAADRIGRLLAEEGIGCVLIGDPHLSEPMGAQRTATALESIYDAVTVDGGILFEPRSSQSVGYRTQQSLYSQDTRLTVGFEVGGGLVPPLDPVEDMRHVTNDVTVRNAAGGSARSVQLDGPLSILDPPKGVGRYPTSPQLPLAGAGFTVNQASWRRHTGTWDEERYPSITVDLLALDAAGKSAVVADAKRVRVGDRIAVDPPPPWRADPIDQLALGIRERITSHRHQLTFVAMPAGPYQVPVIDHPTPTIVGHDGTTVDEEFQAGTDTQLVVAIAAGRPIWTYETDFDILAGGVRLRVTGITGTGPTQTFTVQQQPINGVTKTIPVGAEVRVFTRHFYGR